MAFTSTQSPLARLQEVLFMLDYVSQHLPVGSETPFEQVLVALDQDLPENAEAQYVMQLFFAEDVMRASGLPEMQEGLDHTATLQFMLEFPVDCSRLTPERQLATFSALNLFTQVMPLGNLGINQDKKIFFRYGMMGESQNMNASLVAELIGMFGFFLSQFGPLLQNFVTSDKSVEALMEETGFHKAFAGIQPK
ncbi:MAG: hypothetical protein ACAI44_34200 [Candidatus Sericytochromatia bacterium]